VPAHLLGPHVVGQRVVVRRVLVGETGPTGGPAFTDVLGICESWADGVAVIRPESGPPVEIPIELIVSGKPVPPRASARQRISVRDAELHTAALTRGIEISTLGEWQFRYEPAPAGRVRSRFNSCLAMGSPGLAIDEALTAVVEFYAARGRTPQVQVEAGSAIDAEIRSAGWRPVPGKDSVFMLGSLAQVRRRLPTAPPRLAVTADGPYLAVHTSEASGDAGLDGDWIGLHGLVVDPGHRRTGLARAVIAALLEAGAEQGATTVWLHVETTNAPALALYDSLGFAEHHRCRYYATD